VRRWLCRHPSRLAGLAVTCLLLVGPALARDSLGIFETWGAFRDAEPLHCYAIAEPVDGSGAGRWRPFATISHWPEKNIRGQLHIRLSRARRSDADVMLVIGDRKWRLVAGASDAWSPSGDHDSFILAKMRAARSMSISSVAATGSGFADTYSLKGAATAIDAAALGCASTR
jgi:hypothetical protein